MKLEQEHKVKITSNLKWAIGFAIITFIIGLFLNITLSNLILLSLFGFIGVIIVTNKSFNKWIKEINEKRRLRIEEQERLKRIRIEEAERERGRMIGREMARDDVDRIKWKRNFNRDYGFFGNKSIFLDYPKRKKK
ncbi:MAG: hypothetical protein KJ623_04040 [Nanoarchaeota archaeon]|nr:hypothetical protein [Nanoarchaeota archaeon]MBU0962981.1 hypothetical protein [Nanoarchaeota archaeon]